MNIYEHIIKRLCDIILSGIAILVLALPMLVIALAIKIDDPGPALFKQKRVGIKKNGEITYFTLWKFRSMKMSTPHDMPTHLFGNPEQYITRVGRFIRKMSLDELMQLFQVFTSKLSIVGPRPALWNQYDLIAKRDKYGASDIKPGITGWAQVHGRDELEIDEKARLDGEYAETLKKGGVRALFMDCKCLWCTVSAVLRHDGVIEGGTGKINRQEIMSENLHEVVHK